MGMSATNVVLSPSRLSRVVKMAFDSGEAATPAAAHALFEQYRVRLRVGKSLTDSASLQAALLTVVNVGRRCFLGGIEIDAPDAVLDARLRVTIPGLPTLRDALFYFGARGQAGGNKPAPEIWVGDPPDAAREHEIAIRATFDGWRGAAVDVNSEHRLEDTTDFIPAAVLAAALSVSEVFQYLRRDTIDAASRDVGLSLWRPEPDVDWRRDDGAPKHFDSFPSQLWLLGLGHLGQAYLWTLGLIPYSDPSEVSLVLQDIDDLEEANDSTSLLTQRTLLGLKKTRAMAHWAEARGFKTRVIEREFSSNFSIDGNEPRLLLGGVDNATARSQLEHVGFSRIIDAGLGTGAREYLSIQLHSFPSHARPAAALWSAGEHTSVDGEVLNQPAYIALANAGLDACGLTTLAGRSVGAPFVGATAAALVIAEAARTAVGAHTYAVIDATLRAMDRRRAIRNERDLAPVNVGLGSLNHGRASGPL
jgi:hypothetical protein